MKFQTLFILLILFGLVLSTGCTTTKQNPNSSTQGIETILPSSTLGAVSTSDNSGVPKPTATEKSVAAQSQVQSSLNPEGSLSSRTEKKSDMAGFISMSFPEVTETYSAIKKSRNAMDWKKVQDQAMALQIQVQDLKKTYQLEVPNPEKNVFPDLNSREQIVFLKYISYLNDLESYATNLKNAVYYQEKGNDPQTAHRYQNIADQFEKQVIAEVKTISDYCNDFKYTFLNPVTVQVYRFI
jgi:hypothetical protein